MKHFQSIVFSTVRCVYFKRTAQSREWEIGFSFGSSGKPFTFFDRDGEEVGPCHETMECEVSAESIGDFARAFCCELRPRGPIKLAWLDGHK